MDNKIINLIENSEIGVYDSRSWYFEAKGEGLSLTLDDVEFKLKSKAIKDMLSRADAGEKTAIQAIYVLRAFDKETIIEYPELSKKEYTLKLNSDSTMVELLLSIKHDAMFYSPEAALVTAQENIVKLFPHEFYMQNADYNDNRLSFEVVNLISNERAIEIKIDIEDECNCYVRGVCFNDARGLASRRFSTAIAEGEELEYSVDVSDTDSIKDYIESILDEGKDIHTQMIRSILPNFNTSELDDEWAISDKIKDPEINM